ncbi:MAG: site-specific integrase [bacterium]
MKRKKAVLSDFAKEYVTYSKSVHTAGTSAGIELAFSQFIRIVRDLTLEEVSVRIIERFLAVKTSEASIWTARNYYASLASAFNTAVRWGLLGHNVFKDVKKPKANELMPLYFTTEDFAALLATINDPDFRDLCLVGLYTGLRLSEISSLEWDDIDFDRSLINLRNKTWFTTKTKRDRVVPISKHLMGVVRTRREAAKQNISTMVFHREGKRLTKDYISKQFKKYVRKSGVNPKLHFHSLRHSAGSHMVQSGVSIYTVQKVLGHASISTTQIYAHLRIEDLQDAVNRIPAVSH